jgi:hypothetical protein
VNAANRQAMPTVTAKTRLARRSVGGIGILGCRFRNPCGKGATVGEEVLDAGAWGNFDRLLIVTNGVLYSSKKEHVAADGSGVCGGHRGIVTPGLDCGKRGGIGA